MPLGIRRKWILIWRYIIVQHSKLLSYNTKRNTRTEFDQISVVECVLFVEGKQQQVREFASEAVVL